MPHQGVEAQQFGEGIEMLQRELDRGCEVVMIIADVESRKREPMNQVCLTGRYQGIQGGVPEDSLYMDRRWK